MPVLERAHVVEVDVAGLGVAAAFARASASNAASCSTGSFCSL